jgi:hypothetical protein
VFFARGYNQPPSKKDSFPSPHLSSQYQQQQQQQQQSNQQQQPHQQPQQQKARVIGVNEANFDKEVIQSSIPCVVLVASEAAAQRFVKEDFCLLFVEFEKKILIASFCCFKKKNVLFFDLLF